MRFENRVTQVAMCSFCALIGVIGVAELTNARTTVPGVIFTLLGGALAYRALQSSSVVVSDTEVTGLPTAPPGARPRGPQAGPYAGTARLASAVRAARRATVTRAGCA